MIKSLFIHRFRGIKQGRIDDLRRFNVFIGPNNSGKTAVLELLYMSATSGRPTQFFREDLMNAEDETRARASAFDATTSAHDLLGQAPLPCLRQRHNKNPKWKKEGTSLTSQGGIRVKLGLSSWPEFLLAAPPPTPDREDDAIFVNEDLAEIAMFTLPKPEQLDDTMMPPYLREQGLNPPDADWHYLWEDDWAYRWAQQSDIDKLAIWATQGQRPAPEHVIFFNFNTVVAHFSAPFANNAYHGIPGWEAKIAAQMAKVFPTLENASLDIKEARDGQPGYTGYVRFPGKTPLPVDQLGDGARHAFKLLTALVTLCERVSEERPGMLLWEEPEVFMHAATLSRILEVVFDLVRNKPIQVGITTQSIEVLAWMAKHLEPLSAEEANRFKAYHFYLEQGYLQTHPFAGKALGGWMEFFGDPRMLKEEELKSPLFKWSDQPESLA